MFADMNGLTKIKVKLSGYTYKHLAEKINVHPQYFSMVMRGERSLSLDKEAKLKELLTHVELPVSSSN